MPIRNIFNKKKKDAVNNCNDYDLGGRIECGRRGPLQHTHVLVPVRMSSWTLEPLMYRNRTVTVAGLPLRDWLRHWLRAGVCLASTRCKIRAEAGVRHGLCMYE